MSVLWTCKNKLCADFPKSPTHKLMIRWSDCCDPGKSGAKTKVRNAVRNVRYCYKYLPHILQICVARFNISLLIMIMQWVWISGDKLIKIRNHNKSAIKEDLLIFSLHTQVNMQHSRDKEIVLSHCLCHISYLLTKNLILLHINFFDSLNS